MNDELIDNGPITEHHVDISYANGNSFGATTRILAGIFLVFGLMLPISGGGGLILGPVLIFASAFVLTSSHGVDVCFETKYIREYHKRFFIKSGEWKSTYSYPDICILKLGKSKVHSDISGGVSTQIDVSKNEVYLMTPNHRKRMLIKICNSVREAVKVAEFLAEKLDKKVTQFNPELSEKTKQRMRYGR